MASTSSSSPLGNDQSTNNSNSSTNNTITGGHLFCAIGSPTTIITDSELQSQIHSFLSFVGGVDRKESEILVIPPDYTRYHSHAGEITRLVAEYYNFIPCRQRRTATTSDSNSSNKNDVTATTTNEPPPRTSSSSAASSPAGGRGKLQIMPALGTHLPMSHTQITKMFGLELASLSPSPFIIHDWRNDVVTIGHVPSHMVSRATYGLVNDTEWPAQLNKLVWEKRISNHNTSSSSDNNIANNNNDTTDTTPPPPSTTTTPPRPPPLILSIGQVVPHEVLGMANYNKNLFVGVGGVEAINLSHFIGAIHGMEKLMGRGHNPLRSILNYASEKYIENKLDVWYILTVMGVDYSTTSTATDAANPGKGKLVMRGLYIGNTVQCYDKACELSLQVNFNLLSHAPQRMIVYLNEEYQSTWLGNKAIYRTRMAIADGGELIIIAPHVKIFGEDKQIDTLIRQVGYIGTPRIMDTMTKEDSNNMKNNLSAVAHLIHGSSEGRFTIVYCPGKLSRSEIESVGFKYGDYHDMIQRYDITTLKDGWNTEINVDDGTVEEYYYISNPALGLWAVSSRFEEEDAKDVAVLSNKQEEEDGECSSSSTTNIISDKQQAVDMSGGVGGWKNPPPSN